MLKKEFPKPTGEYAVGTFTYTVKDDREEVLKPGTMRSVAARVYYPVLKESVKGLRKTVALSDNMLKGFKHSFKVAPSFRKNPEANQSECYTNAERISGMRFPLIMFNHGYNSYREGNSFLCIELASHGYVVISVAHSMEGMCTELDDGTAIFYDKSLSKKTYDPMLGAAWALYRLMKARGTDGELASRFDKTQNKYCRFLMGRLPEWVQDNQAALNYAKESLADLIDFEKGVGVTGHSMGGNTAYALCAGNPDFVCGINIDGALFGDYTDAVQTKPFMQISCRNNEYVVTRAYVRHTKLVYKVLFRNMQHVGFSDAKHMLPFKSMIGKLDPDTMHENLCRCHLEFFDAYLKRAKELPDLKSNDVMTVSVYPPDMQ